MVDASAFDACRTFELLWMIDAIKWVVPVSWFQVYLEERLKDWDSYDGGVCLPLMRLAFN